MSDFRGVGSSALLVIIFHLLILDYLNAQLAATSVCDEPMYITVDKKLTVHWTGDDRDGTVVVNITTKDTYGRTCDNNKSLKASFKEGKLSLKNPCSNALYVVRVSLTCDGITLQHPNVTVRTPPDAPTILEMTPTNMSINVKWSKPAGSIQSYKVTLSGGRKEIKRKEMETAGTSWNFTSLEPYTEYEASVMARNEDHWGMAGPVQSVRTLEGVPLEPENVIATEVGSEEIALTWDDPEPNTGLILWFEIVWTEEGGDEIFMENSKNNSFVIKNLFPYTEYKIQVAAVNSVGKGLAASINATTKLAVPDPPAMEIVDKTNTSISVMWNLSDSYRGPDPTYTLRLKPKTETDSYSTTHIDSASRADNYTVGELLPYTTYQMQIRAINSAGLGRWSDSLETKTLVGVPSPPRNLKVDSISSSQVYISWDKPNPPNGPILKYKVAWKKKPEPKQTKDVDSTHFNLTGLSPYTEYDFQVSAMTEAGWGSWSRPLKVRTEVSVPSEPLNLTEAGVTSNTIFIQWEVPKHKNGPHLDYIIQWTKVGESDDDYDYSSENINITHNLEGPEKDEVNETSYEIAGLDPYTNYTVEVCAKTSAGAGKYSKPLIIQTTAGIPTSPTSVKTVRVQSTSLMVQWLSPETTNGPLEGYVIYWGVKGTPASQVMTRGTSYTALGLRPYTEYFFKIAAETEGGQGPFVTIYRRTDISAPTAPMNFVYTSVTDNFILLAWSPPEHPNAPLLQYIVKWREASGDTSTQIHETNNTSFKVRELAAETNYSIWVSAETGAGQGPWTDAIYVRTRRKDHSSAIIAGSVVGCLIILIVIGSVAVLLLAKKKGGLKNIIPRSKSPVNNSSETLKTTDVSLSMDVLPETEKVHVRNFDEHVLKLMSNGYFKLAQEFEKLGKASPGYTTNEAKKNDNLTKNRWVKILPFDYSRVKLLPVGDEVEPDFINASYIPGDSHLLEYIATQGPLPNTVNDFWRMVWQESVFLMVMLTQCVERAKRTCERYWPSAGSSQKYGEFEVHTVSESITPLYIQRLLLVSQGGKQRHIVHFHYMNWPVSGCPKSPDDFLSFVRTVRAQMSSNVTGPTLVHCSAGIGRTGTFIAVDRLWQQLVMNCEDVDIYGTVLEMRKYRANLVQTEEQYYFIHLCVQRIIQEKRQEMENDYGGGIYSN